MKRYLIIGAVVLAVLFLLYPQVVAYAALDIAGALGIHRKPKVVVQ